MIDFDSADHDMKYMGQEVPHHTRETIEHYLLRGWAPGGFVESMLANDLERALYTADIVNRQRFWTIAMWIREYAPRESWGSYDAIEKWRDDFMGCRSAFAEKVEKDFVWKQLSRGAQ